MTITPITQSVPLAGNSSIDPPEGASHPPSPPPPEMADIQRQLAPATRWMRREMVRELISWIRAKKEGAGKNPRRGRRRKRKAALAMSATLMGINTAAISAALPGQPVAAAQLQLEERADPTQQRVHADQLEVSDTLKEALAQEEGVRLTVYRDVAGYPTVGVGHLVLPEDGLSIGDRISYDQALDFLEADLAKAEKAVRRLVSDLRLYQHEFDALVDLVYNVGEGNVTERESPQLNAAINAGDYAAIADQLNYTTAAGQVARGLEFRSERRQAIFTDASYEDPRTA